MSKTTAKTFEVLPNTIVLFQGDSITDCGRNYRSNDSLGQGYVMMISSWFSAKYPERNVRFINRGRSRDRIRDLRDRWRKDCLELRPNVVSILVGINDVLRIHIWSRSTYLKTFENDYRFLLEQARDEVHANLIIMQPFLLEIAEGYADLKKDFAMQIRVVEDLSNEFDAVFIPLDTIFHEASMKKAPSFWTEDGVHPTLPGHALIAQSWLTTVEKDIAP